MFGSRLVSLLIISAFYYSLIRKGVRFIAFPGSNYLYWRNLELEFGRSMTKEVLSAINEMRNSIELFELGTSKAELNVGPEKNEALHSCIFEF
jgi:hypothetical protein